MIESAQWADSMKRIWIQIFCVQKNIGTNVNRIFFSFCSKFIYLVQNAREQMQPYSCHKLSYFKELLCRNSSWEKCSEFIPELVKSMRVRKSFIKIYIILPDELVQKYPWAFQLREAILQKKTFFKTFSKTSKWQIQQVKVPFPLHFLTRIEKTILGMPLEHLYHDPLLHGRFPKFDNSGHE